MDQQIEQNQNKQKANNAAKSIILIAVSFVIFIVTIVNLVIVFSPSASKDKLKISNATLQVESYEYDNETHYTVYVKGTAKNIGGKNYSYASVEFSIYDANNYNLGTAIANINNLADGDTWQFSAMLIGDATTEPTTFKLVKITAF